MVSEALVWLNMTVSHDHITGYYTSALHQVVIRNPDQARYSIPYFISPTLNASIQPQSSLVNRIGVANYDSVTSIEYANRMFDVISNFK